MTSNSNTKWLAAVNGAANSLWNASLNHQGRFVATDVVTMGAAEAPANVIQLFGPGLNMEGCFIDPEAIRIRTAASPSGTISYVVKLQRVTAAGVIVDVTGNITLNRTIPAVAAASVVPQVELAAGETLRLYMVTVTTEVSGATFEIEVPFRRKMAPGAVN